MFRKVTRINSFTTYATFWRIWRWYCKPRDSDASVGVSGDMKAIANAISQNMVKMSELVLAEALAQEKPQKNKKSKMSR